MTSFEEMNTALVAIGRETIDETAYDNLDETSLFEMGVSELIACGYFYPSRLSGTPFHNLLDESRSLFN